MEVIPAIDIRGGKAVRLLQGNYAIETVYDHSPVNAARRWLELGAQRLHVVDLDGARSGELVNLHLVESVAALSDAPVQLGGGVRTLPAARRALDAGVQRVIVGTAALEDEDFIPLLCEEIGADAVVVGVDARDGYVAARGWTQTSAARAGDLLARVERQGAVRAAYTDIARDGTLTQPNFKQVAEIQRSTSLNLLVAGGVASVEHLRRLAGMGVEGAIVGSAAYTGAIDMREAIQEMAPPAPSDAPRETTRRSPP